MLTCFLGGWEKDLLASGRYTELFSCYEVALEYYQNHILYNNLGKLLYR